MPCGRSVSGASSASAPMPSARSGGSISRRRWDVVRESALSTANELVVLCGHPGTHLDALGHASVRRRLFGGKRAEDVESHDGLAALDIASVAPIVARFVLFDVAHETG